MKQKNLLSPDQLERAAQEVYCAAKREGVRVALVGGYALQQHGSPRLTGDVDFVAEDIVQDLPIEGSLMYGGVKTTTSEGVPVDLITRDDEYQELYEEALHDAVARAKDSGMPIVRAEYIAAMKMAADRTSDVADLEFLIENKIIDIGVTRAIIRRHLGPFAAKEFDQTVALAEWRRSRG